MTTPDPAQAEHDAALKELRAAHKRLLDAIEVIVNARQAYLLATRLVELLLEMRGVAAHVRAHQVERIWEQEGTSLAELAEIVGTNKQRAGQFLKEARDQETGRGRS